MSNGMIGLIGVGVLLAMIFIRIPIALALAIAGIGGYAVIDGIDPALRMSSTVTYQLASAYSLSVIPLFVLMGSVARLAHAPCSARFADPPSPRPPHFPAYPFPRCAVMATTAPSRQGLSPPPVRLPCSFRHRSFLRFTRSAPNNRFQSSMRPHSFPASFWPDFMSLPSGWSRGGGRHGYPKCRG